MQQGLISFTKHQHQISSKDLEFLYAANQLGLNAPDSFANSAWFNTILYFGKRNHENQCEMKPGDLYLETTTSRLKYFISSERATKHQSTLKCSRFYTFCFTDVNSETETHFFLVKALNNFEPKVPSFRVFDPRGIMKINFTWQLVKFGWITAEIELAKPIKFTLLPHVNHAHSPSDHHWLFYHVYKRFIAKQKLMGGL